MVRIKHRYMLVNILYPPTVPKSTSASLPPGVEFHQPSPSKFDAPDLKRAIVSSITTLFGEYGIGSVQGSLQVKYFSQTTSTAIIRVARAHLRLVWAALTSISHLPKPHEIPCVVVVLRVSGTIRKVEECAIQAAKVLIRRAQGNVGGGGSFDILETMGAGIGGADDAMSDDDEDEEPGEDEQSAEQREEDMEVEAG